jgi:methylation protein EvaC
MDKKAYENFSERVTNHINKTASLISRCRQKKFLAWGASAKGAVMMNAIHNRWPALRFPSAVIDQTPEKQGLVTPGVHIPVIAPPEDLSDVDVIWILSWNWLERLRYEAETRGFKGKYLVTSPRPRLFAPERYMSLSR